MPPTMRGNPIHSYRRPPCPRLSPAPIPVITASRLTPASCIASIARRVPSENTVTLRRKAGPSVLTPTHQATASAPATARSATPASSTEPQLALGLLRPQTRCSLRRRRRDARPFWPARRVRGQCRCWLRKRRCAWHLSQMSATGPIAQSAEGSCLVVRKARPSYKGHAAARFAPPTVLALIERDEGLFSHQSCGHIADKKRRRSPTGLRHILTCCK